MGDTAFGESFKLMDRKTEDYCYKTTARFLPMLSVFSPIHWVFPFMTRIPILNREINEFDKFEDALFWKRLRSEPREPDVFQWIASEYREKPSPTQQETTNMKADVGLIVIAGSETTRLTLTTLLYNLVAEAETIESAELAKLEYLQACIDESLRFINPTLSGLQRQTPSAGRFSCPGKQLALMSLRRAMALICYQYDVAFAPGQ